MSREKYINWIMMGVAPLVVALIIGASGFYVGSKIEDARTDVAFEIIKKDIADIYETLDEDVVRKDVYNQELNNLKVQLDRVMVRMDHLQYSN